MHRRHKAQMMASMACATSEPVNTQPRSRACRRRVARARPSCAAYHQRAPRPCALRVCSRPAVANALASRSAPASAPRRTPSGAAEWQRAACASLLDAMFYGTSVWDPALIIAQARVTRFGDSRDWRSSCAPTACSGRLTRRLRARAADCGYPEPVLHQPRLPAHAVARCVPRRARADSTGCGR